jgi:outer membrane protein TolC
MNIRRYIYILILIKIFVYCYPNKAEESPHKKIYLTLQKAVEIGLKNNRTVLLPREVLFIQSVAEYKIKRAGYLPQINIIGESLLTPSNLLKLNVSQTLIPYFGTTLNLGIENFFLPTSDENSFYLTFSQPLSPATILSSYLSEKSMYFNYNQSLLEYKLAKQNFIYDVISSYI